MTPNEIIRVFDIVAHLMFFCILLHLAVHTPNKMVFTRVIKVATAFLSLFLGMTCWKYGRTTSFLAAHAMWEWMAVFNLVIFIKIWILNNKSFK
jgi:hypothetical protein